MTPNTFVSQLEFDRVAAHAICFRNQPIGEPLSRSQNDRCALLQVQRTMRPSLKGRQNCALFGALMNDWDTK